MYICICVLRTILAINKGYCNKQRYFISSRDISTARAGGTQNPIVIKNLDASNALENTPRRAVQNQKKFLQNAIIVEKITLQIIEDV